MSSAKKVKLTRSLGVSSFTWATNVLTINTVTAHGLVTGDVFSFWNQRTPELISGAITVSDTDTFTMSVLDSTVVVPSTVTASVWNATATGAQEAFTWGFGSYPAGLVQVNCAGTNGVTVKVQASLDGTYWVDVGTPASQALTGGGTNTVIFSGITQPYLYGRLNFTAAVGASTKVTAFKVTA